jgi:UDP-N-acetyl-D-glucosamine dehydrogenase
MKVSVIGQGYVGLTLAIGAAEAGHKVIGVDLNTELVSSLIECKTDLPGVSEVLLSKLTQSGHYLPTTDFTKISNSEIVVIAVPTPLSKNRGPDLSFLESASVSIAEVMTDKALIINESTSFPGTLRNVIKPNIEKISTLEFEYASAPERIDPANNEWNLKNTPRIIGGLTEKATRLASEFYSSFCAHVHTVSKPEIAEAAKLFENTFRQINIALANEFSLIASKLGFSTNEAILAAATKPFGFMPFYPSIGVGGHCIPVDPSYLSYAANQVGMRANFIELANETNLSMARHVVEKISNSVEKPLSNLKIQLIGISYKIDVADLRESPALILISELRSKGAIVKWHDPLVNKWNEEISSEIDPNVDLGLIVTPHKIIDLNVWKRSTIKVLDLSANSTDYGWPKFL